MVAVDARRRVAQLQAVPGLQDVIGLPLLELQRAVQHLIMCHPGTPVVRAAGPNDAAACAAIYRPDVIGSAITFETTAPAPAEMSGRIQAASRSHPWLVCERGGRIVGYAYAVPFAERDAYRWSCEVSVYCDQGQRRGGIGRVLYRTLLDRVVQRGFRVAVAKLTLPNERYPARTARLSRCSSTCRWSSCASTGRTLPSRPISTPSGPVS